MHGEANAKEQTLKICCIVILRYLLCTLHSTFHLAADNPQHETTQSNTCCGSKALIRYVVHIPHSTLHTFHSSLFHSSNYTLFTLHTPHFTPYVKHRKSFHSFPRQIPHFTLSTFHTPHSSTLYTPPSTLSTPHSTLYTRHSTLYTLHWTL